MHEKNFFFFLRISLNYLNSGNYLKSHMPATKKKQLLAYPHPQTWGCVNIPRCPEFTYFTISTKDFFPSHVRSSKEIKFCKHVLIIIFLSFDYCNSCFHFVVKRGVVSYFAFPNFLHYSFINSQSTIIYTQVSSTHT